MYRLRIDQGDYLQERGGYDWGRSNGNDCTWYDTEAEAKAAAERLGISKLVRAIEEYDD